MSQATDRELTKQLQDASFLAKALLSRGSSAFVRSRQARYRPRRSNPVRDNCLINTQAHLY